MSREPGLSEPALVPSRTPLLAVLGVVVSGLLLSLSMPALWLNRMLTDTDTYVQAVAPLAEDPEVREAFAHLAAETVIARLDFEAALASRLPEPLQIIIEPIAQAARDFIHAQSVDLVQSAGFPRAWEAVNRLSHETLLAAVTGRDAQGEAVEAGVFAVNVQPVVEIVNKNLSETRIGGLVEIPAAGFFDEPIEIYRSSMLANLAPIFRAMVRTAYLLPLLGVAALIASILRATDRTRVVLWFGTALAAFSATVLRVVSVGQQQVAARLESFLGLPSAAGQRAYDIVFRNLVSGERIVAVVGIAVALAALFAGPGREWLQGLFRQASADSAE